MPVYLYEVSQVMNEYLPNTNNKNNKLKNVLILMIIITVCIILSSSIWAEQSETTPSLQQISEIIDSYPNISSYHAGQLLKEAGEAIQYGISSEDTREIIQKSLEKDIKADSIIDILSLLNNLAEDDLPTSSLINKAKEGFAKEVSSDEIISSIREKSENLQFAKYLVDEALLEGADIIDKNKAIEILAGSLSYDIPEDMIVDIFTEALQNNKEIEEAAGAITALSNLLSLGISATSARVVTKDLLNEGYNSEDMSILTKVITEAKKNGLSVLEINSNIIDRIRKGEDALSIEKKLIGYLKDKEKDKEMTAKKDEPSSVTNTPSVGEEVITPTQTTPEPPSEELPVPAEEPSTDEGVAPPTQSGGPGAP